MKSKNSKQHELKFGAKKRRVIRAESEETQDCVRERLAHAVFSQEEADEIGSVPSALSEPRGAVHWCDNRSSEKALGYTQTASMVTEEGGQARTNNMCIPCYNELLVRLGKKPLKVAEWTEIVERKAHRGWLWKFFVIEQFLR